MCDCEFIKEEDDGEEGWHYLRKCEFCGNEWLGLHCPHDGCQNPCPHCGCYPTIIDDPELNEEDTKMICPLKPQSYDPHEGCYPSANCDGKDCAWWDERKSQCCIKTLSELNISGGINTHEY